MAAIPIASTQFHHAQLAELQRLVPQIMWGTMAMNSLSNFERGKADIPLNAGGAGSTQIPFNSVLNLSGNYNYPDTTISAATNLTIGAKAEGAVLAFNAIGNGSAALTYAAGILANGDAFNNTAGRINNILVGVNAGLVILNNYDTGLSLPIISSAIIANANKNKIVFTVNAPVVSPPAAGDIILGAAGGRTVTSVAFTGSTFTATVSSNFAFGDAPTYTIAAGKFTTAGGANAGISNAAISNNISAPASLSITLGSVPGSAILTASAGAKNWECIDDGGATPPAIVDFKLAPPLGGITYNESGALVHFNGVISGDPGYTTTGADNNSGTSRTAYTISRQFGRGAAGAAFYGEFVVPVDTNASSIDVYVMSNGGSGDICTLSAVLADGSATASPLGLSNSSAMKRVTIAVTAGSVTTVALRLSNSNGSAGGGSISIARIMQS